MLKVVTKLTCLTKLNYMVYRANRSDGGWGSVTFVRSKRYRARLVISVCNSWRWVQPGSYQATTHWASSNQPTLSDGKPWTRVLFAIAIMWMAKTSPPVLILRSSLWPGSRALRLPNDVNLTGSTITCGPLPTDRPGLWQLNSLKKSRSRLSLYRINMSGGTITVRRISVQSSWT